MRSESTLENNAFALWNKIAREFGVPKGKERLDTVRQLRDLHINNCGDYLTYEKNLYIPPEEAQTARTRLAFIRIP
jgi:hypothetical protein